MPEQESDRTFGTHIAAKFGESMPYFGDSTNTVVRHAVNDQCGTINAIAFVTNFFIVSAFKAAGAALNSACDIILGHIRISRFVDGES